MVPGARNPDWTMGHLGADYTVYMHTIGNTVIFYHSIVFYIYRRKSYKKKIMVIKVYALNY